MRKPKLSLRTGLLTLIVLCWLVPMLMVVTLAGILISNSYEQSARQELDAAAQYALREVSSELEIAIGDSKEVSYDGVVRTAYRGYQQGGNIVLLYRSISDYLAQNYSRAELYKAVFLSFWDERVNADAYVYGGGKNGADILRECRAKTPEILQIMAEADTDIRFLLLDGELYMARNLLDSHFAPYASIVMLLEPSVLFQPLSSVGPAEDILLSLDDAVFCLKDFESGEIVPEEKSALPETSYRTEAEGHAFSFSVAVEEYSIWQANPWLIWVVLGTTLMVLPLLLVMILLFRRHVSKPVETLVQANLTVQSGQRGYAIDRRAPNTEFGTLYDHFNDMSTELKSQFERSYLEQQAAQRAQIKALQSQINPHFLNNTLEIINWEARLAGNDRVGAMIEALSTMLDAALDRDGRTQIPLKEEMSYVDAYLYIIRERMGEGLQVYKEIDDALLQQMIPRLILQPIVENAVEHDITERRGGRVWVRARLEGGRMLLEVEHDGRMSGEDLENVRRQLSGEEVPGGSLGIRNVSRRLKLIYGEAGTLTLENTEAGTILARLIFPVDGAEGREGKGDCADAQ